MKSNFWLIAFFCVSVSILDKVAALDCYECSSPCSAPTLKTCTYPNNVTCQTTETTKLGVNEIAKICAAFCVPFESTIQGVYTKKTCCATDRCNLAPNSATSLSFLLETLIGLLFTVPLFV